MVGRFAAFFWENGTGLLVPLRACSRTLWAAKPPRHSQAPQQDTSGLHKDDAKRRRCDAFR